MAKTEAESALSSLHSVPLASLLCTLFWVHVFSLVNKQEGRLYKEKNGSTSEDHCTEDYSAYINLRPKEKSIAQHFNNNFDHWLKKSENGRIYRISK